MKTYIDPRKFTGYRIYIPGKYREDEVIKLSEPFTTGEPVIISRPVYKDNWEIGYCDYDRFIKAAGAIGPLWKQGEEPNE